MFGSMWVCVSLCGSVPWRLCLCSCVFVPAFASTRKPDQILKKPNSVTQPGGGTSTVLDRVYDGPNHILKKPNSRPSRVVVLSFVCADTSADDPNFRYDINHKYKWFCRIKMIYRMIYRERADRTRLASASLGQARACQGLCMWRGSEGDV